MKIETVKEKIHNRIGQEFWRKLNLVLLFFLYAMLLTSVTVFRDFLNEALIIIGFIVISYVAFQQYYIRKRETENAGTRVMWGWNVHALGIGEEFEFPIKQIVPDERLSEKDRKSVDKFVELMIVKKKEHSIKSGLHEMEIIHKREEDIKNAERSKKDN